MQTKYQWLADPGHEWLAVPMADLDRLGVRARISHYSYESRDRKTAYLEGDCDAVLFLNAYRDRMGHYPDNRDTWHSEGDCFVRRLPRFPRRVAA